MVGVEVWNGRRGQAKQRQKTTSEAGFFALAHLFFKSKIRSASVWRYDDEDAEGPSPNYHVLLRRTTRTCLAKGSIDWIDRGGDLIINCRCIEPPPSASAVSL